MMWFSRIVDRAVEGLVALVFIFDEPFSDEICVSPKSIIDTVAETQACNE
jgi:hypothetical protein